MPRRVYNEMTWTSQQSIDAFPENYGYEHDFWQHNGTLADGLRPSCQWGQGDEFWATRGGGEAMFWNFPPEVDPYFEEVVASDSCRDMDLSVGMFTPQNLTPHVRYWASINTVGDPAIDESLFVLRAGLMPNDCPDDIHSQWCVGLPEYGEPEYFEPLIGKHDAPVESVPGCFRWTLGAGHNECYDIASDNPVGYWRLGDTNPVVAEAEIGPDGRYSGVAPQSVRGALRIDPDGATALSGGTYAVVPDYPQLNMNAVTVEAWVRTSTDSGVRSIAYRRGFHLAVGAGRARGFLNVTTNNGYTIESIDLVGKTDVYDGKWHHLGLTYDGLVARLFVDGKEEATRSFVGRLFSPSGYATYIGTGFEEFIGEVDELAIYPRALSSLDFEKRFAHRWTPRTGCDGSTPYSDVVCMDRPIGYWRLSEFSEYLGPLSDFTSLQNGTYQLGVALGRAGAVGEDLSVATTGASNSYASIPYEPYGTYVTERLTAEVWVRTSTDTGMRTVMERRGAFNLTIGAGRARATIYVTNNNGYTITPLELVGRTNLNDGKWHHVAVTYGGRAGHLYVDGVEGALEQPFEGRMSSAISRGITLAKGTISDDLFIGRVDEIALYDFALPKADIAERFGYAVTEP